MDRIVNVHEILLREISFEYTEHIFNTYLFHQS